MSNKTERLVMIRIETERYGLPIPFLTASMPEDPDEEDCDEEFDGEPEEEAEPETVESILEGLGFDPNNPESLKSDKPETSELVSEGRLILTPERAEISYEESIVTGMEGSVTTVGFDFNRPHLVSMCRSGMVSTALVFEPGKRHISVYQTPFSAFEICVHTLSVVNRLLTDGSITLDYLSEIHGAQVERCKMKITVKP